MAKRHELIGIKQVLYPEWLNKTLDLVLAGLETEAIRSELKSFIQKTDSRRSDQTISFALTNLMNIWVTPSPDLISLRDDLLFHCRGGHNQRAAAHWAMITASYPFWFNVTRQVGRLFSLQEGITQSQIINRVKEQYGDRQTVSRFGRYVIRSFVAWGVMRDTQVHGCYEKASPITVDAPKLLQLMIEAALQATPEGRASLDVLSRSPAFFPFQFTCTPKSATIDAARLEFDRYNIDDVMVSLKRKGADE